jgi:hypothetical protein
MLLALRGMPARAGLLPARKSRSPSRFPSIRRVLPTVFLRSPTEKPGRSSPPFVGATCLTLADELPSDDGGTFRPVGGAAFFHNKTWTIIPTLEVSRVYVHPWVVQSFLLISPL